LRPSGHLGCRSDGLARIGNATAARIRVARTDVVNWDERSRIGAAAHERREPRRHRAGGLELGP